MRNPMLIGLAVSALVLVGGGCVGKKPAPGAVVPPGLEGGAMVEDSGSMQPNDAAMEADKALEAPLPAADVDAAVNDIIKSLDAEAASDDETGDADELEAAAGDTSELEGLSL